MLSRVRISQIVTIGIVSLFLWGIVWPVILIDLRLPYGTEVLDSLLTGLRQRFPDQEFDSHGVGKGESLEQGPGIGIQISSRPDLQVRKEMLDFVEAEIERQKYQVSIRMDFMFDKKAFILYKSRKIGQKWAQR